MKYPMNQRPKGQTITNYSNRGMDLESDLNITNQYYLDNNIAVIYKKPTPIKIVKVSFNNKKATIDEAYFQEPSTTDYNGIYKGKYIDFEAKEVKNSNAFALANIHKHQVEHIEKVIKHGGIGFIIVRFTKINKTYILGGKVLIDFIKEDTRKSIPISLFEDSGILIKDGYMPRIDYLKAVDKLFMDGDLNE